ncbi:unknown protein [Leptolyngbya sp. NIES-3755]|nr:unknown protein [Leptolyngbya sp. NIES-3755]
MEKIQLRQHTGKDGVLHLEIPTGLIEREIEVVITYQQLEETDNSLEQLYGICADNPIVIDEEGISESLDDDMVGAFQ